MTAENDCTTVGIVGLGRMGRAIAKRLASEGLSVRGWTRSGHAGNLPAAGNVTHCLELADLVSNSDVILISVLDDIAVESVIAALIKNDLSGKLLVETSTVGPDSLRRFAPAIVHAGARVIDAPISGGPELVATGEAGFYVGGAAEDVGRFRPVASLLSNRFVHIGSLGAGYAAKIVNNMMLAGFWQTLKEAMQVGGAAGLDIQTMMDVLQDSPAANGALRHRAPVILGVSDTVGFSVDGAIKDVSLFLDTATQLNVETPALAASLESFVTCRDAGHGKDDLAVMVRQSLPA